MKNTMKSEKKLGKEFLCIQRPINRNVSMGSGLIGASRGGGWGAGGREELA